jgi:signal transduction histidine kinase
LEVRDDGHGFDLGETPGVAGGMGLLSMEHYAAQAGLELSVVSSREAGTIVRASTTINA